MRTPRTVAVAATTAAILLASLNTPAVAHIGPSGSGTVTVTATYQQLIADAAHQATVDDRDAFINVVRIGATTVHISEAISGGLTSGQQVKLTVDAPPTADTTPEVAAALDEGSAKVVNAVPTAVVPAVAQATAGPHSLTILPVYWTKPDGRTTTQLGNLGKSVGAYWKDQTNGAVSMPTVSVKAWKKIANPGTCDETEIANDAMAANGITTIAQRAHVLVYFPSYADCGWIGLASMPGDQIWINGYQNADGWEHEFGHNLGLGHANSATCTSGGAAVPLSSDCDVNDYADYDVMGYARYGEGYTLNAALADLLGTVTVPTAIPGMAISLVPITAHTGTRAVKIVLSKSTLYLEYRPKAGRNAGLPAGWAGIQVRQRMAIDSNGLDSRILAMGKSGQPALPVGRAWTAPGSNLTLTVDAAGASGVKIHFATLPGAPTITSPSLPVRSRSTSIALSWKAATSAAGVARYEVRQGTAVLKTVAGNVTHATVVVPAGVGTLSVVAFDNNGQARSSAGLNVTVDGTVPILAGPVVKVRAGVAAKSGIPVTVSATCTDAVSGIAAFSAAVNGRVVTAAVKGSVSAAINVPGNRKVALLAVATDRNGNTASRAATVSVTSVNQSSARFTGAWKTRRGSAYSASSAKGASAARAKATWTFTGTSVAVIGYRSANTGVAQIYLDGRRIASVDTRRSVTAYQQVLWAGSTTAGRHTISVVVAGTRGRSTVVVDGFASIA